MFKELEFRGNLSEKRIIDEARENGFPEVVFKTIKFQDKNEALEYLNEINLNDKAVFVKYFELIENPEENKGLLDLKESLLEEEKTLSDFPLILIQKLKEQTSSSKGCKCCKSSINKDYLIKIYEAIENISINDFVCPICKDKEYVLTSTEEKRIENINKRIENLENKIRIKETQCFSKAKKEEIGLLYGEIEDENEDVISGDLE